MKASLKLQQAFSFIIQKISHNWFIKVICLILAVFLYLFYEMSLISTETKVIPLVLKNEGGVELVSLDHSQVKVVVSSKQSVTVKDEDIVPSLNLNYLTSSGNFEIPVEYSISDELMKIDPLEIKIKPEKIKVHVEKKIAGAAKVLPNLSGEPAYGYFVKEVKLNPEVLNISGPESVISNIDTFYTEAVNISGIDKSFSTRKLLRDLNRMVNVEEGREVEVEVVVEPVVSEKEFHNVSPVLKNKKNDLEYISLSRDLSVKFSGPVLSLDSLGDDTVFFDIDLSNITEPGDYVFPISFNFGKRISVVEKSFTDWNLTVIQKLPEVTETEEKELEKE